MIETQSVFFVKRLLVGAFYCCLPAINLLYCHHLQIKLEEDNRRGMSCQEFISHEHVFKGTLRQISWYNAKHLCFFKAVMRAGKGKSRGVRHPEFRSSHRLSDSFFLALSNLEVSFPFLKCRFVYLLVCFSITGSILASTTILITVIQIQNQNGYIAVNSQDADEERSTSVAQEKLRETQEEGVRKENQPSTSQKRLRVTQEGGMSKQNQLSTSQLIIRRGLTALTAVLILSVGMTVHFVLPLPEVASITNSTVDLENSTLSTPITTQMLSFWD